MAIVIGDIHGNVEKVKAFLAYRPDQEHVALGDYVDSFFEPPERQLEALQLLLDSDAVLLWGNHDVHYLKTPPWICTGFQHGREEQYQAIIEANKDRFKAAYAVDGWICTHAGVQIRVAKRETDVVKLASRFNAAMRKYLKAPVTYQRINYMCPSPPIFNIGTGRGGDSRAGGIYWLDFKREDGLDLTIRQIFGHTETKEPVVTDSYVALDTTNNKDTCWVYDTMINELAQLDMVTPPEYRWPRRRHLPLEEQEPFHMWLLGQTCPAVEGVPPEDQDFYYPWDYRSWKAGL